MRNWTSSAVGLILLGVFAAPAAADFGTDQRACNGPVVDPDTRIAACSRQIASGRWRGNDLAVSFSNRGNGYRDKADYDRAIADYSDAIRLDPRSAGHYNSRGNGYYGKGDYDRAMADYGEAIRLDPTRPIYYNNRGAVFNHKHEYDRAIAEADEALRRDPRLALAHVTRAVAFTGKVDYDRAIAESNEAIRLNPNLARGYGSRAVAFEHKGDYERAIADWNQAVRLDPRGAAMHGGRGNAYILKGDYDRAIPDFDEAIRIDPKAAAAYNNRGYAYLQKGNIDGAIRDLDAAISLDAKYIPAYLNRGDAYRQKGDLDRAFADLNEALRLDSKWTPAYAFRGLAFERKGDRERAIADFKLALSLPADRFLTLGPRAHAIAKERLAALLAGPATPSRPAGPPTPPRPVASAPAASQVTSLAPVTPVAPAAALDRRVALVIGNSAYQAVPVLPNPAKDAKGVAEALKAAGFAGVWTVTDATHDGMIRALRAFQDEADKADWAAVYYAGHGLEIGGTNYLVPTDAHLKVDRDAQDEAVPLNRVLDAVAGAKKLKLVVLDACRDNPFAQQMQRMVAARSVNRGLTRIDPEGATLVVYAAKDGETADDGTGDHSPFTAAFIQRLQQPGVEINKLFRLVIGDVLEATGNHQRPFVYGSIPGNDEFYFRTQ